jgi:hypothetical protein
MPKSRTTDNESMAVALVGTEMYGQVSETEVQTLLQGFVLLFSSWLFAVSHFGNFSRQSIRFRAWRQSCGSNESAFGLLGDLNSADKIDASRSICDVPFV